MSFGSALAAASAPWASCAKWARSVADWDCDAASASAAPAICDHAFCSLTWSAVNPEMWFELVAGVAGSARLRTFSSTWFCQKHDRERDHERDPADDQA